MILLSTCLTGCATLPYPHKTWKIICRDAPYHGGDVLAQDVLMALYTLPVFPSMTEINAQCPP